MKRNALKRKIHSKYDTQGEFADALGITPTGLSLIIMGKSNPSLKTVEKCCELLEIKRCEIGEMFFPAVKE